MINYNKTLVVLLFAMITGAAMAQNGVNSPYTRYGFGQLSDQTLTGSRGMGGIGYGLRNKFINVLNPASYSGVDSITFILDAGVTLQNANFSSGDVKMNVKNSSLDYIAMQFRLYRKIGMTFGFLPYSRINYSFSGNTRPVDGENTDDISAYDTFSGDGGLRQIFAGIGIEPFKNLSLGFNFSYLYGDQTHTIQTSYTNSSVYSNVRNYQNEIGTYKLDFGAQYTFDLKEKHQLTVGAAYSLGHDIDEEAYKIQQKTLSSSVQTQTVDTIRNAFQIPHTFGIGFTYVYDQRLTVGFDYTLQQWGSVKYPDFAQRTDTDDPNLQNNEQLSYGEQWSFRNASRFSLGAEYIPNPRSRNFFHRLRYRFGGYYSIPYINVKSSAMREFGVEGGVAIPIMNGYNDRSILSITAQYVNMSPEKSGLIKENYLRINIGFTFNEDWFRKTLIK